MHSRSTFLVVTRFAVLSAAAVSVARNVAAETLPATAQGSLNVHWSEGAADCSATPQQPLQVYSYEPHTFILRQNLCLSFEGNFLYLLIGSDKALLIDTGAIADSSQMPLAKTVMDLLPDKGGGKMPLLVVHTHGHLDHRAGDSQFASTPLVKVVGTDVEAVRAYFGFANWPNGTAQIELGGRTVDVIPTPGHQSAHVVFYDRRTAVLFSGDFLMPGRLTLEDSAADYVSALRVVDFFRTRPLVHVLGGHIELDAGGHPYRMGSHYHPNEHGLELSKQDLLALPSALKGFNGFYARYPAFILSNPKHNLAALATAAVALLSLMVWGVRRWFRGWRRTKA